MTADPTSMFLVREDCLGDLNEVGHRANFTTPVWDDWFHLLLNLAGQVCLSEPRLVAEVICGLTWEKFWNISFSVGVHHPGVWLKKHINFIAELLRRQRVGFWVGEVG